MPNINSCNIAGHAAADAELIETKTGKSVCEIRLALKSGWGENEKVIWTKLVIWGKPSEWMSGAKKGDFINVVNAEYCFDEYIKNGETKRFSYFTANNRTTVFYVQKGHFKQQISGQAKRDNNGEKTESFAWDGKDEQAKVSGEMPF